MGKLTPLNDTVLEAKAIVALQKDLRTAYPSRWSVIDSRVGTFLDSYIRLANTVKKPLKGNVQYFANLIVSNMAANAQLAADFMNSLSRCIANGSIPPNPLADVIGWARGSGAQSVLIAKEEQIKKETEGPSYLEKLLGSWGTMATALPWILIVGGGAFVWFTYGEPQRRAIRKVTRT